MIKEGFAIAKTTIGITKSNFRALWAMALLPYLVMVVFGVLGLSEWIGIQAVYWIGVFLVDLVYSAALLRALISAKPFSENDFRFGHDEWRLLTLYVLQALCGLLAVGVIALLMGLSLGVLSVLANTPLFGIAVQGIFLLTIIYLVLRVMTCWPILFAYPNLGVVQVLRLGWLQTKGHVGKLFVSLLVLFAPIYLIVLAGEFVFETLPESSRVVEVAFYEFSSIVSTAVSMIWSYTVFQTLAAPPETR